LRPARIGVIRASRGRSRDKLPQVSGGLCVGELRFVEFDVVTMLESGEKLDAIE